MTHIPVGLEYTTCNVCGSDDSDVYLEQEDMRYKETPRGKFRLVKCKHCDLIYLNPRPTEATIGAFYPESFYADRPEQRRLEPSRVWRLGSTFDLGKRRKRRALEEKQRVASKHCDRVGRLLDVGCAAGEFLVAMQARGWYVEGVDISKTMCDYVQSTFGITCHNSSINHLNLPANSADVVTFWASMEHIFDPKAALLACHHMLKKKGVVIVLVPNADSLEEKWLGGLDPNPIDVPRHLYHFSVDSMTKLLNTTGFAPKRVKHFTYNAADRFTVVLDEFFSNGIAPTGVLRKVIRSVGRNLAIGAGDLISRTLAFSGRSHSFIIVAEKIGNDQEDGSGPSARAGP